MIRKLHRWPSLFAAILLIVLAISGSVLSVFPALDRMAAPPSAQAETVAELAALVIAEHPGVEQIKRSPSGNITVWWFEGNTPGAARVDPATGKDIGSADPSAVEQWFVSLHRSLFLDDTGRIIMAVAAASMLSLTLSGTILVLRRVGGWRHWFSRQRGPYAGRLHTMIARVAVPVLFLSAITALWMVASTFDLIPADEANPVFPAQVSNVTGFPVSEIAVLQATQLTDLRDLTFPTSGDTGDVFTLTTASGEGYIDQGTGRLLDWATPGPWTRVWEWIYLLHTGQGAALWGLILGLVVLSVPILAVTGTLSWIKARRGRPRLHGMVSAARAHTVILVGSEGGSTWGFAATLAKGLQLAGQSVHVAKLADFAPQRYQSARQIIVMAATWGNGTAPSSAKGVLENLAHIQPTVPLAVLGFGDRSFPAFCAFAEDIAKVADRNGWSLLLPMDHIDRQSPQDFARWGRNLGLAMDVPLDLNHQPVTPQATELTLISRRDYGETIQAPAAILRFALPKQGLWQRLTRRGFGRFKAGDLLGIVPEGAVIPRYYSLASCHKDGFVEIAMRKHQGGLCSGQLISLLPGQMVKGFIRSNPEFRPDNRKVPLILIGAGTGIGPLAGFVRAQGAQRPIHLWFGARHPETDFLYGEELSQWAEQGQLSGLHTAFSRSGQRIYVQDAVRQDAQTLRDLIANGAKIMVCGGRDMGAGVRAAITDVLAPLGMSADGLISQGRYAEDVY